MPTHVYDGWCDVQARDLMPGRRLHTISEINGARALAHPRIVSRVLAHYEDPRRLAARTRRLGLRQAANLLHGMLPRTKKARSGHIGEILATETVPAILPTFKVPIKRLRWLDGRESALRGEDLIAIEQNANNCRFLKGESKSRVNLSLTVVNEARSALRANAGRPSQHAMSFVMQRLFDIRHDRLALVFEEHLLMRTIPAENMVHLLFSLSGNDASTALQADLTSYSGRIEQHSVGLHLPDHARFVASIYRT